jgi:hypothetical protein
MKYFTPELIALGRSGDPRSLDEQEARWEEAGERYSQYLDKVRGSFPKGVRRLFNRYYLHDATIHRVAQKDRFFLIELQLDPPPHSFLTFRYRLLCPAEINKEALPPACRSRGSQVEWLYAEIEQVGVEEVLACPATSRWVNDEWLTQARIPAQKSDSEWPFWNHRVLLSNGWELNLFFHDVKVEEYEDLLVPEANGRVTAHVPASPSA